MGWCKITQVSADHSSSCGFSDNGIPIYSGTAAGWIIRFPGGVSVYHAGDTGVFGDMKIIDDLYKPTHMCLPIGGHFTMGPEEAAYAVLKYLTNAHTIIPMHYRTFSFLVGDYPDFCSELKQRGVMNKTIIDSYADLLGKMLELHPK